VVKGEPNEIQSTRAQTSSRAEGNIPYNPEDGGVTIENIF